MESTPPDLNDILDKPITKLAMSTEFMRFARMNGFNTLREVMEFDPQELIHNKGMDGKLATELSNFIRYYTMMKRLRKE